MNISWLTFFEKGPFALRSCLQFQELLFKVIFHIVDLLDDLVMASLGILPLFLHQRFNFPNNCACKSERTSCHSSFDVSFSVASCCLMNLLIFPLRKTLMGRPYYMLGLALIMCLSRKVARPGSSRNPRGTLACSS